MFHGAFLISKPLEAVCEELRFDQMILSEQRSCLGFLKKVAGWGPKCIVPIPVPPNYRWFLEAFKYPKTTRNQLGGPGTFNLEKENVKRPFESV